MPCSNSQCRLIALLNIVIVASAQAWEVAPEFPDNGQPRAFAAAVNSHGDLYVIGGTPYGTDGDKDTPVHILTFGAASWITGLYAEGSIVRQGAGIDSLGRMIVFGGVDGRDPEGDIGADYVYDPNEGQAQAIAQRGSAAPEDYFAWTTDDSGRIYSLGGGPGASADAGQPNSPYAERYDATTDSWTPIAPLPVGLADAAAAYDGRGHILVFGGFDALATTRTATVWRYDIQTDTWSGIYIPDMPAALTGHRAVLGANERIYILGGVSGPAGSGTTSNATYVLHLDSSTWSTGPAMLTARRHFATVLGSDDYIYALGGENDSGGTHLAEKLYTPRCPTILVEPEPLDAWNSTIASFTVEADGGQPLSYQWRKDGINLTDGPTGTGSSVSGATAATLVIAQVGQADGGNYDVIISNACGDTPSASAALTILYPPTIPRYWDVQSIHPSWAQNNSFARGIGNGRIGGEATTPTLMPDGRTLTLARPVVWEEQILAGVDVTPPGSVGGGINDVEGDLLVGWFWHTWSCPGGGQTWTCAWQSAGFWTAPSLVFAEAVHSSGADFDYLHGTDGSTMAGRLYYEYQEGFHEPRAYLWSANNTGHSLHFTEASDTGAYAIDGDRQYGWYRINNGATHAIMWMGTPNSHLDLHPAGYATSFIYGAGDGQAVGSADSIAGLWVNTAASYVELNPAGATSSSAVATHQGLQAGKVGSSAAMWSGTAESYFDLGSIIPAGFTSSQAEDFDIAPDGTITVVGYGYNSLTGRTEALLWRSAFAIGDCDQNGHVDPVECLDMLDCLAGPAVTYGAGCDCYDADADLDNDLSDFAELQVNIDSN
jgi:hypothetical protein